MKRTLTTVALLLQCLYLFSQASTIQVKQDTITVRNAELVIESKTKGIPGVLYNSGDGKTEFRRIELKNLGDTAIAIVGQDTLKYSSFGGANGKSVQFKTGVSQGYPGVGDSIYTNPDFVGKNLKVWRNGVFQYRDPNDGILIDSAAGQITFRPALALNDRIYMEATGGISLIFELPPMAFSTNLKLNAGVFDYGSSQTLRWTTNNTTLNTSPRIVGLGSSTLAGHGLSGIDKLGDKIVAWLGTNTTSPDFNNLSVGGYSSTNLLPVAEGGTAGHNIDSALNYKPDFIFISLPSNDIAFGMSIQQTLANYRKIDNLALSKGVPVFWETPQPRTQFNASEQTRLKVLADSVRAIWPTRFVEGFSNIVSTNAATDAVIKPEYAQSDGVHLTGAGVQQIANSLFARWKAYFQPIYGVSSYEIQQLDVSGSNEIVSDPATIEKTYSNPSRLPMRYSVKANFTNGTSIVSNIATFAGDQAPPAPSGDPYRILVDLGGDGVNTTAGSTKLGQVTTSPDFNGNYWNNWFGSPSGLGFNNNSTITNLVTADNTVTPISLTIVGNPYGNTGVSGTNAININGFYTVTPEYPSSALSDNMFMHNSINPDGIILRISGLLSSKHYEVKLWGARIDGTDSSPSRMLEASTVSGSEMWTNPKRMETRYFTSEIPNFSRSIIFTGLTGPGPVDIHLRPGSGSSYAHLSLVDIKISDPQGAPSVDVQNASITLPTNSVQLTGSVNPNGNTITEYQWTQLPGGPSVATLSSPTAINCTMGNLTNGTYTFRLTVKTSTGGQYADEATVTVLPGSSGAKTMRVHFSAAAAASIPGWLNMFGDVTNTHIVKTDPGTGWIVDNVANGALYWKPLNGVNAANGAGHSTQNNSGVVPDEVLSNYWFVDNAPYTGVDNLWIRGLNPAKSYTIRLIASRHSSATGLRWATWRINGGTPVTQNASGNTSQMAVVNNVAPDGTGKIRIAVYSNSNTSTYGTYSYLNGLIIEEQ